MYIFDRNSTADDDSPVLVPHHSSGSRSLSRRSALSARGKAANKSRWSLRRRSLPDTLHTRYRDDINIRKDNDENDEENGDCNDNAYARWQRKKRVSSVETTQQSVPPEGVRLYDRPVNISEWVDLGRASLDLSKEDPDMFLKLHSAESKMLQSSKKSKGKTATQHAPKESLKSVSSVDETSTRDTKVKRRRSFTLSLPTRKKRSNSASLPSTPSSTTIFNIDKRKKEDQVVSDPEDNKNQRPMSLGARLSRSLSFSRGKKKSRQQANSNQQALKVDDVPATAAVAHKNAEPSFTPAYKSYRLPIQVERAMYRLSHAKLANPCRPLHQQVLISNFMFWYLSLLQNQQHEANIVLFSHPPPPTPPHFVPPPKSLRRKSFTDSLSLNYYKSSYKKQWKIYGYQEACRLRRLVRFLWCDLMLVPNLRARRLLSARLPAETKRLLRVLTSVVYIQWQTRFRKFPWLSSLTRTWKRRQLRLGKSPFCGRWEIAGIALANNNSPPLSKILVVGLRARQSLDTHPRWAYQSHRQTVARRSTVSSRSKRRDVRFTCSAPAAKPVSARYRSIRMRPHR